MDLKLLEIYKDYCLCYHKKLTLKDFKTFLDSYNIKNNINIKQEV